MICLVEWTTKAVEKDVKKNSGLTGNGTLTFAMTGHIALPIKLIKPTVLLSTGTKRDPGEEKKAFGRRRGEPRD